MNISKESRHSPRNKNLFITFVDNLKEKTEIPVFYVLASIAITAVLVFFGILDLHLTNIISVVFPAYWTMRAMEREEKEEEKQWLSYWFIWAFLFLFDLLIPFYMRKIPYYYFAKLLFLTWLYLPNTRGASYIYNNYLIKLGPFDLTKLTRYTDKFGSMMSNFLDSFFHLKEKDIDNINRSNQVNKDLSYKTNHVGKLHGVRQQLNETVNKIRDIRQNVNESKNETAPIEEKYGMNNNSQENIANEFVEERIITPHTDKIVRDKEKVDLSEIVDTAGKDISSSEPKEDIDYIRKIQ